MRLVDCFRATPLALVALASCHGHGLRANHAWVRLSPVPGRPAAAYLTIHGGAQPARLVSIGSSDAGSSELHESMTMSGGMMTMKRLDGLDVPAHGKASFAPGGNHVMLFGVSSRIKSGDEMPLVLNFAHAASITVKARVVAAGDPAPY